MTITVPYQFTPRDYQIPLFEALDTGKRRALVIWNRRAGKEKACLNLMIKKMLERVGTYYYFFPEFAMSKRILWEGADKDGFRFLDHFPKEIIDGEPNSSELKIRLKNGSLFQLIGTDNYDAIRGSNPVGVVFSEYAFSDPGAWDVVRPILAENFGWAIFNTTPNGKNHAYEMYEMAKDNPDWFVSRLTVDDTKAISLEAIEEERRAGASEEFIQQEFYCSFDSGAQGSYYGSQIRQAETENRLTSVPHTAGVVVDTYWDLGIGDAMSIWFVQQVGKEIHFIDYLESDGESMEYYAKALKEKPYVYGRHYFPHDGENREIGTGKSRKEVAEHLGIRPISIVAKLQVDDGINAVRMFFNRCWFDKVKCKRGIDAIRNYSKEWDEKRKEFKAKPNHDWSSHANDALRYCAVAFRERTLAVKREKSPRKETSLRMA